MKVSAFPSGAAESSDQRNVPGTCFSPEACQAWQSAWSQTLVGEETDLDFRLVQPATVLGRVVNRESVPKVESPHSSG